MMYTTFLMPEQPKLQPSNASEDIKMGLDRKQPNFIEIYQNGIHVRQKLGMRNGGVTGSETTLEHRNHGYCEATTSKDDETNEMDTMKTILSGKSNCQLRAPRLATALETLWKIKMNSMTSGKKDGSNVSINEKVPMKKIKMEEESDPTNYHNRDMILDLKKTHRYIKKECIEKTNQPGPSGLHLLAEKLKKGGDPSDLLDSSTSSYNNGVHQYVSDFGSMEYSLQQPSHLTNNNNSYVYANDSTTYQYYQYSGNVHSPSQQYLVSGNHSPGSADDEHNTSIQHATRASPATIQWLLDNYEPSDGTSLPRCTLYDHYKKHCMEYKLDPVNAASFGKLIRNVFQNLRTRRLGTRGNSKYHYYGIRVKPSSLLNRQRLQLEYNSEEPCAPPRQHSRPVKRSAASQPSVSPHSTSSPVPNHPNPLILNDNAIIVASEMDKQSLGVGELPNIEIDFRIELEEEIQKLGLELSHVCKFMEAYKLNCSDILYCVRNIAFDNVSHYWTTFWQSDDTFCSSEPKLDKLTRQQIFSLCTIPCIQSFIIKVDLALYQVMVDILIPDVLLSEMTSLLIQACRSFAKNAESYLRKAMRGAPDVIQKKKIQAVKYMTQALRRYTSLNHLSQAARTVLHKPDQVAAMYSDCVKVDIAQVQEQAGWVCGCDIVIIKQIHNGFKENLQKMVGMNHWADWMDAIVEQNVPVLTNYHGKTVREVTKIAKKFLLHWSLYTSMLIRDLTLRSANSFGSFHLIRLLSDEYMLYLIESKLGKAFNKPTISVMTLPTDYPIFDDLDDQEDIILQMPSALPPISLNSIYMPHDSILYGDKFILGGDEHINSPVVVTDNGDMLTAMPSSNELL